MEYKLSKELIVITGACGFVGSCMVSKLNRCGFTNLILVDSFGRSDKNRNLKGKKSVHKVDRQLFFKWLEKMKTRPYCIIHLGAKTDTRELNYEIHKHFNEEYSKQIWNYCTENSVKLIYASSAATYGCENDLFSDDHSHILSLKPLNPYAISKNNFDIWAIQQKSTPPTWIGLKFFNVYGPNEYHKNGMASMVYHTYNQIRSNGRVKLFRSSNIHYLNGEQKRDFIYVKDVVKVITWLLSKEIPVNGIFNLGTGEARSFNDLVDISFRSVSANKSVMYVDMPADLENRYQYYTRADMSKLKSLGYKEPFLSLEAGINDYVRNYLNRSKYY